MACTGINRTTQKGRAPSAFLSVVSFFACDSLPVTTTPNPPAYVHSTAPFDPVSTPNITQHPLFVQIVLTESNLGIRDEFVLRIITLVHAGQLRLVVDVPHVRVGVVPVLARVHLDQTVKLNNDEFKSHTTHVFTLSTIDSHPRR